MLFHPPCSRIPLRAAALIVAAMFLAPARQAPAGDWPQYMGSAARTGDAADEALSFPLGLIAQVKLDDAVTTSPAVVAGTAYVVDQMGTAYAVEAATGKLLWKTSPDGDQALGSNTSSPAVHKGRVYYGTTAGNFHILEASSGRIVRTIDLGSSVIASPTLAGDRIYIQSIAAVIHCLDLDGTELWRWDHYERYTEPLPENLKNYFPRSYDRPHYGGGEIAVSGRRLVTGIGWDHVCLEDTGDAARLVWCNRAALGKDDGVPLATSISGEYVYTAWPGVDGAGNLLRCKLADGSFDRRADVIRNVWAVLGTPAVRDNLVVLGRHHRGVEAHEIGQRRRWSTFSEAEIDDETSTFGSPVLTKSHCLFTTVAGELIAVDLAAATSGLRHMTPEPFRFQTAGGKPSSSTPAVADGRVLFGSDDGCLYILGPPGTAPLEASLPDLPPQRSTTTSATGRRYDWPSPGGDAGNTRFVEDDKLSAPLRLRYAARNFGLFHQPLSATRDDLVFVSLAGTVAAVEQQTGRIRWRRRLPRQLYEGHGLMCAEGKILVARPLRYGRIYQRALWCLDGATGETLWEQEIGAGGNGGSKAPAVVAAGHVALATVQGDPEEAVVQAWNLQTGKPAWSVKLACKPKRDSQRIRPPTGCAVGDVMFFSVGGMTDNRPEDRYPGETIAVQASTGKVLWRTREAHTTAYSALVARDNRLFVCAYAGPMTCLDTGDGSVLWQSEQKFNYFQHGPTLGKTFFAIKGYGGDTRRYRLEDCRPIPGSIGGTEHTCSSSLLTSGGLSLVCTVGGMYVRDADSAELLWLSRGFAPRNCANPCVSNGRVFVNPQVTGVMYCFEPDPANGDK